MPCQAGGVEGAEAFRNPREALPAHWTEESQRTADAHTLQPPLAGPSFLEPWRPRLTPTLRQVTRDRPGHPPGPLAPPAANEARRLWAVERLTAHPEPPTVERLPSWVQRRDGSLKRRDGVAEAARRGGFPHGLTPAGPQEGRARETLRPLLLLALFAEGTHTGSHRVATAKPPYGEDALLSVRQPSRSVEALRHAHGAVVNQIVALWNPQRWGDGPPCASDGKRFASWRQTLMTAWRSRYHGSGIVLSWHGETTAGCLYAPLRHVSFSAVAAMIAGLLRHDTERRVEKHWGDSPGQSAVAVAFCHLWGGALEALPQADHIRAPLSA